MQSALAAVPAILAVSEANSSTVGLAQSATGTATLPVEQPSTLLPTTEDCSIAKA